MKRIFLFFFFALVACLFSHKSFAQGNLQFNQVINFTFSLPTAGYGAGMQFSTSYTVPAGKVWKVETMAASNEVACGYSINGIRAALYQNQSYSAYKGPLWLKEGTQFQLFSSDQYNATNFIVSIIEFNIVP